MLSVEDITVKYGAVTAVRSLTMNAEAGEIVALIGSNGAGKSTTLNTIAGGLRPVAGDIRFQGRSIRGMAPETIVRLGIALVPERRRIFERLTVAENLTVAAAGRPKGAPPVARDLEDLYARFPVLAQYRSTPGGKLSGGEQQQLAIARALMTRPTLLLLDEPSLGLAPLMVDLVFAKLAELRETGVTVVLVEQNAARAVELADRVFVLRTGSIELAGAASAVTDDAQFERSYLGI